MKSLVRKRFINLQQESHKWDISHFIKQKIQSRHFRIPKAYLVIASCLPRPVSMVPGWTALTVTFTPSSWKRKIGQGWAYSINCSIEPNMTIWQWRASTWRRRASSIACRIFASFDWPYAWKPRNLSINKVTLTFQWHEQRKFFIHGLSNKNVIWNIAKVPLWIVNVIQVMVSIGHKMCHRWHNHNPALLSTLFRRSFHGVQQKMGQKKVACRIQKIAKRFIHWRMAIFIEWSVYEYLNSCGASIESKAFRESNHGAYTISRKLLKMKEIAQTTSDRDRKLAKVVDGKRLLHTVLRETELHVT